MASSISGFSSASLGMAVSDATASLSPAEFVAHATQGVIRGEARFGFKEWNTYFGEVQGEEPPLPHHIAEIENAICPFSNDPNVRVKDTHMWVCIPAKVNNQPLTLRSLQTLIQNPLRGHAANYHQRDYKIPANVLNYDKNPLSSCPDCPGYWLLMPRGVVPGSAQSGPGDNQMPLFKNRPAYTFPYALEAMVCLCVEQVTCGGQLFVSAREPIVFTTCQEVERSESDARPIVVGQDRSTPLFYIGKDRPAPAYYGLAPIKRYWPWHAASGERTTLTARRSLARRFPAMDWSQTLKKDEQGDHDGV